MGRRLQFTLLSLIVCFCSATMGFSFPCKEAERQALLKLKPIFFDPPNRLSSWIGQDCCSWRGVGCDNVTSNVVKLDLRVYANDNSSAMVISRKVTSAILELKYLRYLDLSGNYLNYNRSTNIPSFFGSLRQLQYLNLSNTLLGGEVSRGLRNLTKLVVLDLSKSSTWSDSGIIMGLSSLEWAFKLESLRYLDLSWIDLSQALDSLNILHKLPSLSVLNLANCGIGNFHQAMRNLTASSRHIHHLDLSGNLFNGRVPNFIQNLTSIRFLDLSLNHFSSSIPSWLGNKGNLRYLSLHHNHFNGPFPPLLQNLSVLTSLDLSYNQLSSSLPSWLANKRYLEYLSLGGNYFSSVDGGIMNIIGHLCRLKHLDLSHNQLQEEVYESHVYNFSMCGRYDLKFLHMENNNMSGQLPIFESLLSLQELDLSHNNFEIIPTSFGKLLSLESLDLSYNHLTVVRQVDLANFSRLRTLDMSSNFLTLELSADWMPPFQLHSLHIPHCKLNNPFPKWLLTQEEISEIDLSDTGIFGPLPENIGNAIPSLSILILASNDINGSIPKSLCDVYSLEFLDLQKNRLSGHIPNCWENAQILGMELSSNKLSGQIPSSLTEAAMIQLLSLNNNSLKGELPLSFSSSFRLMVLDVGNNNLQGKIPAWNGGDFLSLQILILRGNKLEGMIPPQLCSISQLQIIDLASNNVVGTIPRCFGHFENMGSMLPIDVAPGPEDVAAVPAEVAPPEMNPDQWSAVEVIRGQEREYTTVLHLLVNMDLSCNSLEGVIPTELASLSRLFNLNLSHNHLMGSIPKEIGKMRLLESLDLSSNNLSGSIPESLSSLNYLAKLNLSFNNLQGQIPTGSQLQTLDDPSIYKGNPGLCGDPLPKCFPTNDAHPPTSTFLEDDEDGNKHDKMWFYLITMLGFATGFWGVIGSLVVKRRWRYAYFSLAEELADWILVITAALTIARAKRGR